MAEEKLILDLIPTKHLQDFISDIYKIFKLKHDEIWQLIPSSQIDFIDQLDLHSESKKIIEYVYKSQSWGKFNDFIVSMQKYIDQNFNKNDIKITLSKQNKSLEEELAEYIKTLNPNSNICFKYKLSVLNGFIIDVGSTRIDCSYASILSKFVGELHESFKF